MPYASKHICISIPEELHAELKREICDEWELPITAALRKAVREFIDKYKQGEKQ
jgi:metal-responsive CopG/Arc/MetJ family transcriptional regulator